MLELELGCAVRFMLLVVVGAVEVVRFRIRSSSLVALVMLASLNGLFFRSAVMGNEGRCGMVESLSDETHMD